MRVRIEIAIAAVFIAILFMAAYDYHAYKQGRQDMYADMIQAAGGKPGARLEVHYDKVVSIYHEATTCAYCHTS